MCLWHGAASSQHSIPLTPGDQVWGEPWGPGSHLTLALPAATLHSLLGAGPAAPQGNHAAVGGGVRAVAACGLSPLHCPQGSSQQSREPALGSTCSALGQFTITAGEAHVPSTCPAWLAAVLTALSPVPCRVSRDTTTTRTPGCSGWAPAIASSPSGSARYGPCQEGGPGTTGMFQPYSLWLLCQSTPSAFWAACPP